MIHRAIAAALLVGLGLPVLAGQFASPAYDQAQGLAGGRTQADSAYDGARTARGAVQGQVSGALATGGLAEPAAAPISPRAALLSAAVPAPASDTAKGKFFSGRSLMFGGGGAIVGATAGWLLGGGPLGAAVGALVGFAIGFALSKLMR